MLAGENLSFPPPLHKNNGQSTELLAAMTPWTILALKTPFQLAGILDDNALG